MTPRSTPGPPDGRPALLRAAHVRRAHGLLGEVRVESLGGDILLAFDGVDTPEAAGLLRGAYLCVEPERARHLPAGEWFVWQLVGLAAVDAEGNGVGVVSDVEAGPAHDVLVVESQAGERRFPMVSAFVSEVDLAGGRIVLTPWEEEEA